MGPESRFCTTLPPPGPRSRSTYPRGRSMKQTGQKQGKLMDSDDVNHSAEQARAIVAVRCRVGCRVQQPRVVQLRPNIPLLSLLVVAQLPGAATDVRRGVTLLPELAILIPWKTQAICQNEPRNTAESHDHVGSCRCFGSLFEHLRASVVCERARWQIGEGTALELKLRPS